MPEILTQVLFIFIKRNLKYYIHGLFIFIFSHSYFFHAFFLITQSFSISFLQN